MTVVAIEFKDGVECNELDREICLAYWTTVKRKKFARPISEIAAMAGTKTSRDLASFVRYRCKALSDIQCRCGRRYEYLDRSDYMRREKHTKDPWVCCDCASRKAKADAEARDAEARLRAQREAQWAEEQSAARVRLRARIKEHLTIGELTDPLSVPFGSAISWYAMIRMCATGDEWPLVASLAEKRLKLIPAAQRAPTDCDKAIVRDLIARRMLYVDPDSPLDAFEYWEDWVEFDYGLVRCRLSSREYAPRATVTFQHFARTLSDRDSWPTYWRHECPELVADIWAKELTMLWKRLVRIVGFVGYNQRRFERYLIEALRTYNPGQIRTLMEIGIDVAYGTYLRKDPRATIHNSGDFAANYFINRVRDSVASNKSVKVTPIDPRGLLTVVLAPILRGLDCAWYTIALGDLGESHCHVED